MANTMTGEEQRPWRSNGRWMTIGLAIVITILMAQAISYSGLIERFAEWEFAWFGRYFPALTLGFFVGLFAAVWVLVAVIRRRLRGRDDEVVDRVPRDIGRLISARRILLVLAMVAGVIALGAAIDLIRAPRMVGPVRTINIAAGGPATLVEGPVQLTGITPIGPIARQSDDLLFNRHTMYLVPIGRTRMLNGTDGFNLFVQSTTNDPDRVPRAMTGLMRFDSLPLDIRTLYRNHRIAVADSSTVLFIGPAASNRPQIILIIESIVAGLIALGFAAYLKRRARRVREAAARAAMAG